LERRQIASMSRISFYRVKDIFCLLVRDVTSSGTKAFDCAALAESTGVRS
jgi:hypothetical protein